MVDLVPAQGNLINGMSNAFRDPFPGAALDATIWDQSALGSGMGLTVTGGTLQVTMGTTAAADTYITTKASWVPPVRARVSLSLSQKIAGNAVYVELVAVKPVVGSENVVAAWCISGDDNTTTTNAVYEAQNGGASRTRSASSTVSTVTAASIYELELTPDDVWFHTTAPDTLTGRANSYMRNSVVPDPAMSYKLRLRFKNTTAPATSTTVTVQWAAATDYTETPVEVTGGRSGTQNAGGVPTYVTGSATLNVQPTMSSTASSGTTAKVNAAASTNATLTKSTAGRVYSFQLTNTSAAVKYFKFFNKATAPTVGTDTPVLVVAVPANMQVAYTPVYPIQFATGIGYAIVGGPTDLDATAVAVNDVVGHFQYV